MKSYLDFGKSFSFYLVALGLLMAFSMAQSNLEALRLSVYFDIPDRKIIAAGLLVAATVFGMFCVNAHNARVAEPWKVPQSKVSITFAIFWFLALAGLVVSK